MASNALGYGLPIKVVVKVTPSSLSPPLSASKASLTSSAATRIVPLLGLPSKVYCCSVPPFPVPFWVYPNPGGISSAGANRCQS